MAAKKADTQPYYLGLDGCKAGWVAAKWSGKNASYQLLTTNESLLEAIEGATQTFIDIPIGLESEIYNREADVELRKVLGKEYASSVFDAPIRPAAEAPSYSMASMISFDYTEKKISMQTWNITPKIMQIDALLRENEHLKVKCFESHPELLFKILNGGNIVEQKKSTGLGVKHRINLLKAYMPNVKDLYREVRENENAKDLKDNDLLDAMALAVFAKISHQNGLKTIPEQPKQDEFGLTMAIHYAEI
jgi:predicted RNase H-like nuclease